MYIGDKVQVIDPLAEMYGEVGIVADVAFSWAYVTFGGAKGYEYEKWQIELIMAIKTIKNVRPWKV